MYQGGDRESDGRGERLQGKMQERKEGETWENIHTRYEDMTGRRILSMSSMGVCRYLYTEVIRRETL